MQVNVAAIARIYDPGCKFDHMLTIVGKQGIGKTLIVQRLAGEWFSNSITEIRGKESYEALDGAWIVAQHIDRHNNRVVVP